MHSISYRGNTHIVGTCNQTSSQPDLQRSQLGGNLNQPDQSRSEGPVLLHQNHLANMLILNVGYAKGERVANLIAGTNFTNSHNNQMIKGSTDYTPEKVKPSGRRHFQAHLFNTETRKNIFPFDNNT